jgi:hypothetical protein
MAQDPIDPADDDGAEVFAAARLLRDFLRTDVGGYAPARAEIEQALASSGPVPAFRGNVYSATFSRHDVTLRNTRDHAVAAERFSRNAFAAAFHYWRALDAPHG